MAKEDPSNNDRVTDFEVEPTELGGIRSIRSAELGGETIISPEEVNIIENEKPIMSLMVQCQTEEGWVHVDNFIKALTDHRKDLIENHPMSAPAHS